MHQRKWIAKVVLLCMSEKDLNERTNGSCKIVDNYDTFIKCNKTLICLLTYTRNVVGTESL